VCFTQKRGRGPKIVVALSVRGMFINTDSTEEPHTPHMFFCEKEDWQTVVFVYSAEKKKFYTGGASGEWGGLPPPLDFFLHTKK